MPNALLSAAVVWVALEGGVGGSLVVCLQAADCSELSLVEVDRRITLFRTLDAEVWIPLSMPRFVGTWGTSPLLSEETALAVVGVEAIRVCEADVDGCSSCICRVDGAGVPEAARLDSPLDTGFISPVCMARRGRREGFNRDIPLWVDLRLFFGSCTTIR